jgi:hypothetical protein
MSDFKNVGSPTFKVLLEVRQCVTKTKITALVENSHNGTVPEVIA